ncbi:tripartite tricarboxylate transporter TctB family protein [Pseudonocardia sichuanensis]
MSTSTDTRRRGGLPSAFPVVAGLWTATVLWQAATLWTGSTDTSADLGPAFLPLVLGTVVLVLLAIDAIRQTRRPHPEEVPAAPTGPGARLRRWSEPPMHRFVALAVVAALLGPWIGLAAVPLLILCCLRVVERRSWTRAVLTTALLTAGLYVVFVVLLQVPIDLLPS